MIEIKPLTDNIFDSKMQTLVNPVNCRGVMGAGLAKEFGKRYPEMFRAYRTVCKQENSFNMISLLLYKHDENTQILCFPTKDHWKEKSHEYQIETNIIRLVTCINDGILSIKSLAIPMLGCGKGGLNKDKMSSILIGQLAPLNIPVEIYTR